MKLWLASTDAALVVRHFELGLFAGVLTNPTTLAAANRPPIETIRDLCAATACPVFYQLNQAEPVAMKRQADAMLAHGWKNLGIKVPLTRAGCTVLAWLGSTAPRHVPGLRIKVTNTVGAGDSFNGALLAALAHGCGFPDALRLANATAASVVRSSRGVLGVRPPRRFMS